MPGRHFRLVHRQMIKNGVAVSNWEPVEIPVPPSRREMYAQRYGREEAISPVLSQKEPKRPVDYYNVQKLIERLEDEHGSVPGVIKDWLMGTILDDRFFE